MKINNGETTNHSRRQTIHTKIVDNNLDSLQADAKEINR